jgi:[CysO sulfur-carrier protein]-S-L-cysteine hydrolase
MKRTTTMLKIKSSVLAEMEVHARRDAPLEACGYLGASEGIVDTILPMKNLDASSEHFSLDPLEQLAKSRELRKSGKKVAAVYHSHPATPARQSEEDIRLAKDPGLSYVIISLAGNTAVVKSFQIHNGLSVEEPIEIIGGTS